MAARINLVQKFSSERIMSVTTLRPLLAGLVLLAVSLVLLVMIINSTASTLEVVRWGGIVLAVYVFALFALMMAIRGPGNGPASWHLGPWMMIWVATMFGLGSSTNLDNFQSGLAAQIILGNVLSAFWLVAVGMTAWVCGYIIGPGKSVGRVAAGLRDGLRTRYTGELRGHMTPWLLYGIATAARIASLLTTGRLGYVGDVASGVATASWYDNELVSLGYCAPIGVAAAMFLALKRPAFGRRVVVAVLILAEASFALISGEKTNFIILVMAVLIPYTAVRGRLPKTQMAALVAIFLILVLPFSLAYRQNARSGASMLSVGQAVGAAPQLLSKTLDSGTGLASTALTSINDLLNRGQEIVDVAIIMQRTPNQIPYLPASQIITGPLGSLVPRFLWPGKPIIAPGYYFGQEYLGISSSEYSSSAVTPFGSLYRYGGWVPVIVGMLMLGLAFRMLDDIIEVRGNPHTMFIPLLTFHLVMAEQDWSSSFTVLVSIPVWIIAVIVAFRPRSASIDTKNLQSPGLKGSGVLP